MLSKVTQPVGERAQRFGLGMHGWRRQEGRKEGKEKRGKGKKKSVTAVCIKDVTEKLKHTASL